jgi:Flp pilus assembly protein TadD
MKLLQAGADVMTLARSIGVATAASWIALLAGCAPQPAGQPTALTSGSRLRVADAAEASGDRQTALAMYAAAANETSNDTPTQLRSAEGLARNGDVKDATTILIRRLKATPHDADLMRTLGAVQVMAGQARQAITTLSEVLATKPNDQQALVNEGVALDILHKHDEAQGLYRKALALLPGDVTISNDLALSLMLSGHPDEARLTMLPFRDATDLPERVKTNLGILDAATGHAAEARQALGSRIGSDDLSSLTQAISMQGGSFRPDAGGRVVSRGPLAESDGARVGQAAGRFEPTASDAEPAAAHPASAASHIPAGRVGTLPPAVNAQPVPLSAATAAVTATSQPEASVAPAPGVAAPAAHKDVLAQAHRPLNKEAARASEPGGQSGRPVDSFRPLQEQTTSGVRIENDPAR